MKKPKSPYNVKRNLEPILIDGKKIDNIDILANDYVSMSTLKKNLLNNAVLTPLEFLVSVYSSNNVEMRVRVEAAKVAAKYIHKPQHVMLQVDVENQDELRLVDLQEAARLKLLEYLDDSNVIEATIINETNKSTAKH